MTKSAIFSSALLLAAAVHAAPMPDAIGAMLDAAAGDAAQLATIATIAKKTNPAAAAEIDARVAALTKAQADAKTDKLAHQSFSEGWSGSGEAGGFTSSGNTSNTGVAIGVSLTKETRKWKHSVRGLVDYQRDNGVTSKERYFAGYEGNYNITRRLYALGTLAYEKDKFSGFNRRFSESLGIGYKVVDSENFRFAVEGGPALRQTLYTNHLDKNSFAARGAANIWWHFNPNISLTEGATVFYDSFNTSFQSLTALTAKLNGALSARASVQFNNESNPPLGRKNSDTTTRLTLVYAF